PRTLRAAPRTGPNEPRATKRWRRDNPCGRAPPGIGRSDGDALAALRTARIDDGAAARGLHARTKAVGLLAMDRRRLESALHDGGEEGKAKPEIIADSTIVGHRRNHSPLWITSPDPGKISNRPPAFFHPPTHPSIAPIPMDLLWPSLAAELKKELPAQQYDTWIKPLRAEYQEDQLVLVAPNHHVLRWVRANLLAR